MKELDNCRFVKTVLMIIILVYHSCVFWAGGWLPGIATQIKAPLLVSLAGWLSTFHIYGFTLISGYVYAAKWIGGGTRNLNHLF